MEQLLSIFPERDTQLELHYKSFVYQPERVSLNSRQSITQNQVIAQQFLDSDYYYQFRCELKTPLLGIKSLELIRCSIPNAVPSIPNNEACFYYYRIPADPVTFQPQYNTLTAANIHIVRLLPMPPYSPDNYTNPNLYGWNSTFNDYQSLVDALNLSAQNDPNEAQLQPNGFYIPGDITFYYDQTRNRIGFRGNNAQLNGQPQYYYIPVGYTDNNILIVQQAIQTILADPTGILFPTNGKFIMNKRLGFIWDGNWGQPTFPAFPSLGYNVVYARTAPKPNYAGGVWNDYLPNYTGETFPDLVNTANIYVYCDIVGGSTQDTNSEERLLAVIPAQASNLGVIFGESKIAVPLTKVSQAVFQINFTLRTDTGSPFYLPKSAYCNFEIKFSY